MGRFASRGGDLWRHEKGRGSSPGLCDSREFVGSLGGGYVLRLQPLPALGNLVGHLVAFFEGLESFPGDAAMVHEDVFAPIIRRDKAVALLIAEPLDRAFWGHTFAPAFPVPGPQQTKKPPFSTGWRSISCKPTLPLRVQVYQDLLGMLTYPRVSWKGGHFGEEDDKQPEPAGSDARRDLLFGGRGPRGEDDLYLGARLAGRRGQRGGRGGYQAPDRDGARAREDRGGGGRWEHGGHRQGDGLHNRHGALRRDPRGQEALLRGALPRLLHGRGLSAHRPAIADRDRSRRCDRVGQMVLRRSLL